MTFEAEDLVSQAVKRHGKHLAVACSFGKASTIILHMALKHNPDIKVFFNNTLCQPKETYNHRNRLVKDWGINFIELRPYKKRTFWKCADKYGLPACRKSGGKGGNAPRCCYYLKEKPAELGYKEHGITAVLTGLMAAENRNRKLLAMRYDNHEQEHDNIKFCGQRYYARTQNLWKYHPIMYWNDSDLSEYNSQNQIPLNEFYTKWGGLYKRSGCLPCTAYLDWERKLSKSHPPLYRKLKRIQDSAQTTLPILREGATA